MLSSIPTVGDDIVVPFQMDDPDTPFVRTFTFRTRVLPGAEWERLLLEHRPAETGFDYDPVTFPPALIVASIRSWTVTDTMLAEGATSPEPLTTEGITVEDAEELWSLWPQWARNRVLTGLTMQNVTGGSLGKANGRRNARLDQVRTVTP